MSINFRVVASAFTLAGGSLGHCGSDESPERVASLSAVDLDALLGVQPSASVVSVPGRKPKLAGGPEVLEPGANGVDAVTAPNECGMKLTPGVTALESEGFAVTLSLEGLAAIDADVVLTYSAESQVRPALEANTLSKNLEAVRGGGYVALHVVEVTSLRGPGPLSTPYVVGHVLPRVATSVAS